MNGIGPSVILELVARAFTTRQRTQPKTLHIDNLFLQPDSSPLEPHPKNKCFVHLALPSPSGILNHSDEASIPQLLQKGT